MTTATSIEIAIEERVTKALAQFRKKGVITKSGDTAFNLALIPGRVRSDETSESCFITLKLTLSGDLAKEEEQEVVFVTGATMREAAVSSKTTRLFAYIDGWAQALGAIIKRSKSPSTLTPFDVCFPEALDTKAKDALAFAEKILIAVDERADAVQDQIEEAEKPLLPSDLTMTRPIAESPELEAAIREAPHDRERYLVYADWLSERNDPRGELSICQAQLMQGGNAAIVAGGRADEIMRLHRRYLLGPFGQSDELIAAVVFTWDLGWIAGLGFTSLGEPTTKFGRNAIIGALKIPSSKFLRALSLQRLSYEDKEMKAVWDALAEAGPKPTLLDLQLGDDVDEVSWLTAGEIPPNLPELYPNLESLKIRAGKMHFSSTKCLAFPKMKKLIIETGGLAKENAKMIVSACGAPAFRNLTHLEIWFGSRHYGGTTSIEDVVPLLALEGQLPNLTTLGLKNCEFTDDICAALKNTPLVRSVKHLDLSKGIMTSAGASALAATTPSLPNLEKLDVSENYLSDDDIALLKVDLGRRVLALAQKDWDPECDDPEDRYVTLSE